MGKIDLDRLRDLAGQLQSAVRENLGDFDLYLAAVGRHVKAHPLA